MNYIGRAAGSILLGAALLACPAAMAQKASKAEKQLQAGIWRGSILLNNEQPLPFNFEVKKDGKTSLLLMNAEERMVLDELRFSGDSVIVPLHIFDAELRAKVEKGRLSGSFYRLGANGYQLPFEALAGETKRFTEALLPPAGDVSGKWATVFDYNGNKSEAVGEFKQVGNRVTGTFLTWHGDYRYLDGIITGDKLLLSTFDGVHLYVFQARLQGGKLVDGLQWSGKSAKLTWEATKDDNARLQDPTTLTKMKEGAKSVQLSLPNLQGKTISLQDERYRNKVVVIQILGSWCPNCMDESTFLAPIYEARKADGLEILGVAFERSDKLEEVKPKLERMMRRLGMNYEVVFGGKTDQASQVFSSLQKVMSFPTSIVLDRKGEVREIHTGFSGPGTGKHYEEHSKHFNALIEELLAEKAQ